MILVLCLTLLYCFMKRKMKRLFEQIRPERKGKLTAICPVLIWSPYNCPDRPKTFGTNETSETIGSTHWFSFNRLDRLKEFAFYSKLNFAFTCSATGSPNSQFECSVSKQYCLYLHLMICFNCSLPVGVDSSPILTIVLTIIFTFLKLSHNTICTKGARKDLVFIK